MLFTADSYRKKQWQTLQQVQALDNGYHLKIQCTDFLLAQ